MDSACENKYNREDGYSSEEVDIMGRRSLTGGFVPSSDLLSSCSYACETSILSGLFEIPVSFSKITVQILGVKIGSTKCFTISVKLLMTKSSDVRINAIKRFQKFAM